MQFEIITPFNYMLVQLFGRTNWRGSSPSGGNRWRAFILLQSNIFVCLRATNWAFGFVRVFINECIKDNLYYYYNIQFSSSLSLDAFAFWWFILYGVEFVDASNHFIFYFFAIMKEFLLLSASQHWGIVGNTLKNSFSAKICWWIIELLWVTTLSCLPCHSISI